MKVYLRPEPHNLSNAMYRMADALHRFIPKSMHAVSRAEDADVQIMYVIGHDSVPQFCKAPEYVAFQCCAASIVGNHDAWQPMWQGARAIWSYLQLDTPVDVPTLRIPLGVDPAFRNVRLLDDPRDIGIMTSGYTTGPHAEAIDEVALAANRLGMRVLHLGPHNVENMPYRPPKWHSVRNIPDQELADLYVHSRWVSGLRHVEGFEFPVIEGLACGARPIVFDREDMRHWFDGHAVFIPECHGEELIDRLTDILSEDPEPVLLAERREVLRKFDWKDIVAQCWNQLERSVRNAEWQTHSSVGR